MSEQDIDQPGEFTDQFAERFHRDRREHGGEIDRLDQDQLERLTEEERVEAGVDRVSQGVQRLFRLALECVRAGLVVEALNHRFALPIAQVREGIAKLSN